MSQNTPLSSGGRAGPRTSRLLPPMTMIGFVIAILAVVLIGSVSYQSAESAAQATQSVTRTLDVTQRMQLVLSRVKDAETSQRGFLLTGDESYLVPYNSAQAMLPAELAALKTIIRERDNQLGIGATVASNNLPRCWSFNSVPSPAKGRPRSSASGCRRARG